MTGLVTALGFGVHGEPPLAVKRAAWRPLGRKIAAGAPLNSEPIACFGWDELDHDIVSDHTHGKAVDLRDDAAKRFRRRGAGICSKRRHHGSDETDAASTNRT